MWAQPVPPPPPGADLAGPLTPPSSRGGPAPRRRHRATTMSAGVLMVGQFYDMIQRGQLARGYLNLGLTLFVMISVSVILLRSAGLWVGVAGGMIKPKAGEAV